MTDEQPQSVKNPAPNTPPPLPIGAMPPIVIPDLLALADRADSLRWEPFLEGVDRHWIYRADQDGPAAALIRFQPGSRVPLHEHPGYEHIFVLSGSQTDKNGTLRAGSMIINLPGTRHSIISEEGCLVLAIYEKRVRFLE
jgi:anti-sigma factor ChrR (cupin superfamily)